MKSAAVSLLLHASPVLLNGLLWLIWYVKEKNSHYTMIAEGLGWLIWMVLVGLALNLLAGVLHCWRGYPVPGLVHLAPVGLALAGYAWYRLTN